MHQARFKLHLPLKLNETHRQASLRYSEKNSKTHDLYFVFEKQNLLKQKNINFTVIIEIGDNNVIHSYNNRINYYVPHSEYLGYYKPVYNSGVTYITIQF